MSARADNAGVPALEPRRRFGLATLRVKPAANSCLVEPAEHV
jgi:hypothetical protein